MSNEVGGVAVAAGAGREFQAFVVVTEVVVKPVCSYTHIQAVAGHHPHIRCAAESFHTKKLCSKFFWQKLKFTGKIAKSRFVPPFGGIRGNVHGSSMARWKARGRLPTSANWTFSPALTVEALWADIG